MNHNCIKQNYDNKEICKGPNAKASKHIKRTRQ